jgi:hypothetical protein
MLHLFVSLPLNLLKHSSAEEQEETQADLKGCPFWKRDDKEGGVEGDIAKNERFLSGTRFRSLRPGVYPGDSICAPPTGHRFEGALG